MALPDPTGLEPVVELPLGPVQPRRFLDVVGEIPGAFDGAAARFINGLRWRAWPCRELTLSQTNDPCTTDDLGDIAEDLRTDSPDGCEDWLHQGSFRVEDAIINNVLDDIDMSQSRDRMLTRWDRQISAAFAAELISGAASGGLSLSNTATAPESWAFGAAIALKSALSHLEDEIARRLQGGAGYIHVPPGLLARVVGLTNASLDGDSYRTATGNFLWSDAGYVDAVAPTGGSGPADGEAWLYASGPVFAARTDVKVLESIDITDDEFMLRDFGHGIILFDPCPVTAVLVDFDL